MKRSSETGGGVRSGGGVYIYVSQNVVPRGMLIQSFISAEALEVTSYVINATGVMGFTANGMTCSVRICDAGGFGKNAVYVHSIYYFGVLCCIKIN